MKAEPKVRMVVLTARMTKEQAARPETEEMRLVLRVRQV
jgi:hypothetical protein